MTSRPSIGFLPVCLLASLTALPFPAAEGGQGAVGSGSNFSIEVNPTEVNVHMFYNGSTIHVAGQLPSGYDAVAVLCVGGERDLVLKKKGKVWGMLWMNVGEMDFKHIPSIYLLTLTGRLADLAPREVLNRLGLGYDPLKEHSAAGPEEADQRLLFGELIKLEEREGFFSITEGGVKLEPTSDGAVSYSADLQLPARVAPGDYELRVYGFKGTGDTRGGEVLSSSLIRVKQVGFALLVATLARESGLLYGITAVVVAIGVGLFTGFVFGLGSRGGH